MATDQLQRPTFYEGQYLGASDLAAVIDYARLRAARHSLGGHTWGIVVGLALKEEPALGGGVDVFLQPGYAIDGFGRPLVVPSPVQIPAGLFEDEFSGRVPVWLRYMEQSTGAPGFGFEVCENDDAFSRVVENYAVEVGDFPQSEQRDPVSVAGQAVEAIEALNALDEADGLLCDASIPFQEFPDAGDANWLIPLGYVRWEEGNPGRLVESEDDDRRATRAFRRYAGVIAEDVRASDGVIRLRRRETEPPPGGTSIFAACAQGAIRASGEVDLAIDEETGRVTPLELVWIEGDLRVVGDARLFGGKLEFRDAAGEDHDAPLWLRRVETNSFNEPAGPSGRDLQILLGVTDEGNNRLVVGQVDGDGNATDHVVVQDDGRVGIGTAQPTSSLTVPLTIRGAGGDEDVLGFENAAGILLWRINLLPGGEEGLNIAEAAGGDSILFLQAGGNVGIGTASPHAGLHIQTGTDASLSDTSGFVVIGDVDGANLVIDDNEIIARSNGAVSTLHLQAHGGELRVHTHQTDSEQVIVTSSGNVGIGTISPRTSLHIEGGSDASLSDSSGFLVLGGVDGDNLVMDNNEIIARSNGAVSTLHLQAQGGDLLLHFHQSTSQQVIVTGSGNVGIGTTTPSERLDVRGNVKLGASGDFFAVGGVQNLRIIAGRISSGGSVLSGSGFSSSRTGEGSYRITFSDAFDATPVVVATAVAAEDDDNVTTIRNPSASGVDVRIKSVGGENELQDTDFTFAAFGLRS